MAGSRSSRSGRSGSRIGFGAGGVEAARRSIAVGVEAIETVRELIAREHIACDTGQDGSLLVAHRPSAVADLQERVRLYREVLGYPHVEFLDGPRLERDGYVRGAEASGALRTRNAFGACTR
jgi:FAD dependent oxidoreductase